MKAIYHILLAVFAFTLWCCQDESSSLSNVGYLRLAVSESGQLNTRAYDPKIMHVEIQSEDGEIVKQTNDLDEWDGEVFELPVGNYGIIVYSNDYQGEPAFNSPYYYGDTTVQIKANTETSAKVDCKIANVKVTVNYSEDFKAAFAGRDIFVTVGAADEKSSLKTMRFEYGSDAALYLPSNCGPLKATLNVSKADGSGDYYTLAETKRLAEPKANDHFILNYQMGDTNQGDFTVTVDPTTNSYSYTFYINMTPLVVTASYETVNAWATFAYLEANNVTADGEVDPSTVKFNYRKKGETEWQEIAATESEGTYTARPTGLEDNTTYEYCLSVDGILANMGTEFTTEEATKLYNGSFDNWAYGTGDYNKTWFADFEKAQDGFNYVAGFNTSFWDSGNIGTSTGLAAMLGAKNPTSPEETVVHTPGKKAAKLASIYVAIQFAAGNIYTGNYQETIMNPMGARINWGQPFTSRPTALQGWINYTPGKVNRGDDSNLPSDATLKNGDDDQNSIYIALSDKGSQYEIMNGEKKFIDFDNDPNIIAYGELPAEEVGKTDGWKQVNIPLVYRALDRKPTHIIIVFSASKYGDYFVGSDSSVMYIDDFSLVYDDMPAFEEK